MYETLIILIILVALKYVIDLIPSRSQREKAKKEEKEEIEIKVRKYPYEKKFLLTKAEYVFYKILKVKCDESELLICPKVRLEDFISVTEKKEFMKYRGYIKSRHIDFLICDDKLNIKAAIELDDNSHNYGKQKRTDEFKNNLYEKIQVPLFRVKMSNGMYENEIDKIITTITNDEKY